ncbi:MAG: hypothetical protein JSU63_19055 [Phycisphaerales bacterium]|nr:MAG: hypothetical protein JSU63_19055 [Phycisphaerales bacterium]
MRTGNPTYRCACVGTLAIIAGAIALSATVRGQQASDAAKRPRLMMSAQMLVNREGTGGTLVLKIYNNGTVPLKLAGLRPWDMAESGNFVLCRDGKVTRFQLFLPSGDPTENTLEPGGVDKGFLNIRGLTEGRYDLVGLLFATVKGEDNVRTRIPLPIGHLAFNVPNPK